MGTAMARNLLAAGYDVTVWNRSAAKCQPLLDAGAKQGASPREVAAACQLTFAMLADPAGAMEVACSENGAVRGLGPGKGCQVQCRDLNGGSGALRQLCSRYIDVSTVDAQTAQAISKGVRAAGATYLEAPVSGSKKPAEDGTLIFLTGGELLCRPETAVARSRQSPMPGTHDARVRVLSCAGDRELFDEASPALDVMGKSSFFLGEVGKGASMKLVVNMVMGSMMASFSEGLALGEKAGLDPTQILEVVSQGAIAAPMFALKGPAMLKASYPPAFPLKHQQKDLRLALELGVEVAQPLPVAAAANEHFKAAKEAGQGDSDFSAVLEAVKGQTQH
eukprot:SM000028S10113  [mRNA]  locus=s28:409918:412579:- [translate_table: standard]